MSRSVPRASRASSLSSYARRIVARETGSALQLLDHWVQRAVRWCGEHWLRRRRGGSSPSVRALRVRGATCRPRARPTAARLVLRLLWPAASGRAAISSSRPTSGVRPAPRLEAPLCLTSPIDPPSRSGGSAKPFSRAAEVVELEQAAQQPLSRSAITTDPGAASAWSRAGRFGVSPTTASSRAAPSPISSPTMTSPVAIPTRRHKAGRRRLQPATAWVTASPARTARSASSSCA